MRHIRQLDELVCDIRYALRTFARARTFTAVVLLTLTIGVGANVAVFALVNGLLLKPLPYPAPDRLGGWWCRTAAQRSPRSWSRATGTQLP